MKRIFKYAAPLDPRLAIRMPIGAEVLAVQMQDGVPQLWALVDDAAETEIRLFHWRGTGHEAGNLGAYVGTVQQYGGQLIWHLFEAAR